jgi:ATP-dependent DNA helicase DinG
MRRYFSEDIPSFIDNYEERPEQVAMAEAVKEAIDKNETLIIEAGTGVGKTLAYLIPMAEYAVKNKKRVIISTYSKALQSQIYKKDLPLVKKIFPELKFEIIFGAGNYVCTRRFREFSAKGSIFSNAKDVDEMMEFIREGEGLRENTKFHIPQDVWDNIKREKHLCQEESCKHFNKCYYWSIRHKLRKAHIIVVNHYLFFSDLIVNKKLLPESSAVVFDEAHKLEDTMRDMFSRVFSVSEYYKVLHDVEEFLGYKKKKTKRDYKDVKHHVKAAKKDMEEFVVSLHENRELNLLKNNSVLLEYGTQMIDHGPDLRLALKDAIYEINDSIRTEEDKDRKKYCEYLLQSVQEHADVFEKWLFRKDRQYFYWLEKGRDKILSFYITPYDLRKDFEEHVKYNYECVIFTSATLSAGDNFNYVKKQFGLEDAGTGSLKSPFDYENNSLLYIDRNMPPPQAEEFKAELAEKISKFIGITGGNMFVLFTSIDLMKKMHKAMEGKFDGIPLLIQGQASPMELVAEFRRSPSVLFATSTFWQGIDIKGDDLRCVLITRLPFEVPDHPMQKAIYAHVKEEGGSDFEEIALPRAIFMLKQGFGRLIRSKDDYGVVAILDSRIATKSYGMRFLKSLPAARITDDMEEVKRFFRDKE